MTEQEWLECDDPTPMIAFLCSTASDRKLRLFTCACCRRIWHLLTVEIGQSAVLAAELHADGLISDEELNDARARAEVAHVTPIVPDSAAYSTTWIDDSPSFPILRIVMGVDDAPFIAADFADNRGDERLSQAAIIRDIFGNPFRRTLLNPSWLARNDGIIPTLAQAVYDDRAFDRLPLLADALENAGCDNEEVLGHCRGPGSHVRGCWVVDLVLGKG